MNSAPLKLHAWSRPRIETEALPGPCAVVRMADSPALLANIQDTANVAARLDLVFNDARDSFGLVRAPTDDDARRLLAFVEEQRSKVPHIVFQCQVGIGRSLAAYAACVKLLGGDPRPALEMGTHNRNFYKRLLRVAGQAPAPEPKVSMVVRVKYAPDRLIAFALCMQRQRYENWELLFVTDGPNPDAVTIVGQTGDARIRVISTEEARGHWGHPYRQRGIHATSGDWIGLSNDDNYYVPGYLEQMMNAVARDDADLALCGMLHSYSGWSVTEPGHDLGSWLARRDLALQTPWPGDDFSADARYLEALKAKARRIARIERPLFIHN